LTFSWQGSSQPDVGVQGTIQPVLTADQIQRRVIDIARQINTDYAGKTLCAVGVLEDGFIFMSDLVRYLEIPVVCQFVKPETHEMQRADANTTEIFFSPEVDVKGGDVLLIQGLLQSGVTTEFLMRNLSARGAVSVKVATLLDRQTARRVKLQPDYFGFLVDDSFVFGYGMGTPRMGRNLPFVATTKESGVRSTMK
jgi:hypoxanthine phosphoribosyltransferase